MSATDNYGDAAAADDDDEDDDDDGDDDEEDDDDVDDDDNDDDDDGDDDDDEEDNCYDDDEPFDLTHVAVAETSPKFQCARPTPFSTPLFLFTHHLDVHAISKRTKD